MTQVNADNALAIYRVGPVLCCAPTRTVIAIIEPPANLTHPPGSTPSSPGIFAFNKKVVVVTDLRYRFGVPEQHWKHPGRMIIVEQDDGSRGYWVDDIVDVVEMPTRGWQALPPHLPRGIFKSTLLIKDKILLYAEFDKLAKLTGSGYLREYIEELYAQHSEKLQANISSMNATTTNGQSKDSIPARSKSTDSNNNSTSVGRLPDSKSALETNNAPDPLTMKKQSDFTQTVDTVRSILRGNTEANNNPHAVASDKEPLQGKSIDDNIVSFNAATAKLNNTRQKNTDQSKPVHTSAQTVTDNQTGSNQHSLITNHPVHLATGKTATTHERNLHPEKTVANNSISNNVQTKPQQICHAHTLRNNGTDSKKIALENTALSHQPGTIDTSLSAGPVRNNVGKNNTRSKTGLSLLIILLILLLIGGGYYYLQPTSRDSKPQVISSYTPKPIVIPALTHNTQQDKALTETNIATTNDSPAPTEQHNIHTQSKNSTIDDTVHKVSIKHDEEGIAIIITSPNKPEFISPIQTQNSNSLTTDKNTQPENTSASPAKAENQEQHHQPDNFQLYALPAASNLAVASLQNPSQIKYEFVHVVIKGDTLWHIAIRYLHDPYRYPELAHLSKIKNPDRIYPGNHIRIIYQSR